VKAWPIDPLAFRDLKLEVSEKLLTWLAFKSRLRKGSASRSVELHFGNTVELREVPKALPIKPCVFTQALVAYRNLILIFVICFQK